MLLMLMIFKIVAVKYIPKVGQKIRGSRTANAGTTFKVEYIIMHYSEPDCLCDWKNRITLEEEESFQSGRNFWIYQDDYYRRGS